MSEELPAVPKSSPRRRRRRAGAGWLPLSFIVLASATAGWLLGRGGMKPDFREVPASFETDTALDTSEAGSVSVRSGDPATVDSELPAADSSAVTPDEVGRLKAEILRLRVLFKRLAEAAQLEDDGEFDVDFEIDADSGDGEPLSALDPASPDALSLLIERFDPMLEQSDVMAHIFDLRHQDWSRRVSGRPLQGGSVSSGFGPRRDPISGLRVMHSGLDFVAPIGTEVLAMADGVVTWAGLNGGYGLLVELEHAEGFRTRYAHNDSTIASLGQRVRKGEPIATLGSSGRSTGPHLHLEVRQHDQPLDPRFHVD